MTFYFLYTDFNQVESLSDVPLDLYHLLFGALGALMVLIGFFMPKLEKNSIIGLRTKWNMKNDAVRKKCQVFGGKSLIVSGLTTITLCFFTKGLGCLLSSIIVIMVMTIVDIIYTYRISIKD